VLSVAKFQYTLLSRFPVDCVLRETISMLENHTPDSTVSVFRSQDAVGPTSDDVVYVRYIPSRLSNTVSVYGV